MPTYEFRCPQGHEFENFYRTISGAEAHAACPLCGELAERMMSAAGFAFKGSGFYLTDYGRNAHREKGTEPPAKPADAAASSEASKSEGRTTDAKVDSVKSADASSAGAPSKPDSKRESKPDSKRESNPAAESKPAATPKPANPPKKSAGE